MKEGEDVVCVVAFMVVVFSSGDAVVAALLGLLELLLALVAEATAGNRKRLAVRMLVAAVRGGPLLKTIRQ